MIIIDDADDDDDNNSVGDDYDYNADDDQWNIKISWNFTCVQPALLVKCLCCGLWVVKVTPHHLGTFDQ